MNDFLRRQLLRYHIPTPAMKLTQGPNEPPTAPVPQEGAKHATACPKHFAGGSWLEIDEHQVESTQRLLRDVLTSENLIVLTGLGTSLGVFNSAKERPPKMHELFEQICNEDNEYYGTVRSRIEAAASSTDIEDLLSICHQWMALHPRDQEVQNFVLDAEKTIVRTCSCIDETSTLEAHRMFLLRVASRTTRQPRARIFTTNYDLCFETAAAQAGFILIDGFGFGSASRFDPAHFSFDLVRREREHDSPSFLPNVFHLLKLHGSVDWNHEGTSVVRKSNATRPALIFPRNNKYEASYIQPYFEMMAQFQLAMRRPNTALIVAGFGFNDMHITEPINAALRSNVGLKMCVIDPSWDSPWKKAYLNRIEHGDRRLSAIEATFDAFVPLIPDLSPLTEEQRMERSRLGPTSP